MAYDKVVDSAQLDAALRATSKAIRTKLDNPPEDLDWDMDTGFAGEVSEIQKAKPEQAKLVTPTKTVQEVTPNAGYVLNNVTVNPIPSQYQDVSGVTAGAGDVVYGKRIVGADGSTVDGTLRHKVYAGEIVSTVTGTATAYPDNYVVLVQDNLLAEIRNEDALFVRVEFDIAATAYTIAKNNAANKLEGANWHSGKYQDVYRYGSTATKSVGAANAPLNGDTFAGMGVGIMLISEDGELRMHPNSGNHAIRPSTYTVEVEW